MADPSYSPVSSLALLSAALGITTVLGLLAPEFATIALPGIAVGFAALAAIRKYELSGRLFAKVGITTAVVFAIITPVWHVARFNTEALPGHERLDFASLATAKDQGLGHFLGKKVCLKGYTLPSNRPIDVTAFLMTPDGITRKPETAVPVQLTSGDAWHWHSGAVAVSGTLVHNPDVNSDPKSPKFLLQQSSVRNSKTNFDLANRVPGDGC